MTYCLAIDIGASSGRHILGTCSNGEIKTTEVYRFENRIEERDGTLCWDIDYLTKSVVEGIKQCGALGFVPDTIAIDTWGVDYVLLDKQGKEIYPAVSYRDGRTTGVPEEVDKIISREALYAHTGIQRANYNTIYQLYCDQKSGKLDGAEYMILMPEYLSYKLTGIMKSEYTIASTTSLLDARSRNWDFELIEKLGIKKSLFQQIHMPGSVVGKLSEEVRNYVGFDSTVVFAASHDTASAVAACTLKDREMYISSGTWSLIGCQNRIPLLTPDAMNANFTNEGGVDNTYRFLKNIMGMWLFQNIRRNLDQQYTYDQMMHMAMESSYTKTFDPNDQRLVAPKNMIEAIRECLNAPELPVADVLSSVYHSMAQAYAKVVDEIEGISGEKIQSVYMVGGGTKDTYLNSLTAAYTKKPVTIGATEATALGNIMVQSKCADTIKK